MGWVFGPNPEMGFSDFWPEFAVADENSLATSHCEQSSD